MNTVGFENSTVYNAVTWITKRSLSLRYPHTFERTCNWDEQDEIPDNIVSILEDDSTLYIMIYEEGEGYCWLFGDYIGEEF